MKRETVIILVLLGVALLLYLRRFGLSLGVGRNIKGIADGLTDKGQPIPVSYKSVFAGISENSVPNNRGDNVVSPYQCLAYPNPETGAFSPTMQSGPAILAVQKILNEANSKGLLGNQPFLKEDGIFDRETDKVMNAALFAENSKIIYDGIPLSDDRMKSQRCNNLIKLIQVYGLQLGYTK